MGRIYQTLSQGRTTVEESTRFKVVDEREIETEAIIEDDDSMPYIEVGGPVPTGTVLRSVAKVETVSPRTRKRVIGIAFRAVPETRQPLPPAAERLGEDLVAFHEPTHPVAVQYRGLAMEISAQLSGISSRVVALTAALPQAGTTTVALNLAITLAREQQRVVIVDAQRERPMIANALGLPSEPGLQDVLSNQVPITWALHPTGLERFRAVPCGKGGSPRDPDTFAMLVEQLRRRFDWVIVDGAPAVDVFDGVYLTLRQEDLNTSPVADVHETIIDNGGKLRGYILTT